MRTFTHLGNEYRTNDDASVVERNDGPKLGWTRTGSLGVHLVAKDIVCPKQPRPDAETCAEIRSNARKPTAI